MKESLTKKFGPLPAWAWLLLLAGIVYYYRRYRSTVSGMATSGTASDLTPPTPQSPVVLEPGESVYDPNTGQLVGGSGLPGDSGAGSGNGFGSSGDGASLPGAFPAPAAPGAPPAVLPVKPRKGKKRKLNVKGLTRAGSALAGLKGLSKPRTPSHTRGPRTQAGGKARFRTVARPNVNQAEHKRVKPRPAPTRTRTGIAVPLVHRTENQRPVAKGPAARRSIQPHPQAPPPRAVAHNPGRTVHTGGPPRVARPRGRK